MFRWFARLLYDSTPAEFHSAYGLAESLERLSAATKRSVFSALAETTAVGKVSEKVVRLQRVSELIATALGAPRDGASITRDALRNVDADTVPMSLKVAAIILAVSGAMALMAGVVGPHL
jgi:hypothetical protein